MKHQRLFDPQPHRQEQTGGYIVIIVLLLTAVLLMLGLSLATRTTEEVYLSGQEADTTRVFNAAETGIEGALYQIENGAIVSDVAPTPFTVPVPDGASSSLNVTGERTSDFDMTVTQGEALSLVWKDGIDINWRHAADCSNAPAVILTLYDTTTLRAYHRAFRPVGTNANCTSKGTGFDVAGTYSEGGSPAGSALTPNAAAFGLGSIGAGSMLRIRPLYADGNFRIVDGSAIRLISEAKDTLGGSGTSAETRKIQVIRTDPAPPSIFDYAVFSGTSLEKSP